MEDYSTYLEYEFQTQTCESRQFEHVTGPLAFLSRSFLNRVCSLVLAKDCPGRQVLKGGFLPPNRQGRRKSDQLGPVCPSSG